MNQQPDTQTAALASRDADCAVIPIGAEGRKAPLLPWRHCQSERASRDEVRRWFAGEPSGMAAIGGAVYRNLEILELEGWADAEGLARQLVELGARQGASRYGGGFPLTGIPSGRPSGEAHLPYHVAAWEAGRGFQRARRPDMEAELAIDPTGKVKALAESRGSAGTRASRRRMALFIESRRSWAAAALARSSMGALR